jgi:hypothetical protein
VLPDKDREKARRILLRHVQVGRMAVDKALAALNSLDPSEFPPYMVPKLLETGAAVTESARAALAALSAEEQPGDDPWAAIAAELDPQRWAATAKTPPS